MKLDLYCYKENDQDLYYKSGNSAFDLRSNEDKIIKPKSINSIKTGYWFNLEMLQHQLEMNKLFKYFKIELQIVPRSGLAKKNGITIENTPGTIDLNYQGEIECIIKNDSNEDFIITKGDRIAQAKLGLVVDLDKVEIKYMDKNSVFPVKSNRGETGFGDSGVK